MKEPIATDTSPLMRNPKYRPVFFDFETLRYETMLTTYDVWADKWCTARTPAACGALLRGYLIDPRTVFVGFNNKNFDNLIATACIDGWRQEEVYALNQAIIHIVPDGELHGRVYTSFEDLRLNLPGVWTFAARAWDAGIDLGAKMGQQGVKIPVMSLKKWEKFNGLKVVTSPVPFTHPLPLTDGEAVALADYNRYDVAALVRMCCTETKLKGAWDTRCGFSDMLGPKDFKWHSTFSKLAAKLFVDKPELATDKGDTSWGQVVPQFPACLRIREHDGLLRFFGRPLFEIERSSYSVEVNGLIHNFGVGGLHSNNGLGVFKGDIWDIDVGGMYPSIMALFGLCARSMNAKKYNEVRLARMSMPKSDWRRDVYKQALNSTFGSMINEFSELCDPSKGRIVPILGQLFTVDLLEKLNPYVTLIQSNTDGVYVMPKSTEDAVHALAVIDEFQRRTGMILEVEKYVAMYQRDVNNYIAVGPDGKEKVKGGAFHSSFHARPTVGQMMNRCEIMSLPFDPDQYSLEELAVVCTRDKNSRGFMVDGVETDAETLDVVPVFPLQAQDIFTVKKDGGFCKARLCPDYARVTTAVTRPEIDFGWYQRKSAGDISQDL